LTGQDLGRRLRLSASWRGRPVASQNGTWTDPGRPPTTGEDSNKYKKTEILVAVVALVVSIIGLVWAMKSATSAKKANQIAAQAVDQAKKANQIAANTSRIAAEDRKSAQAQKITFYVNRQLANDGSSTFFVRIVNLSPGLLRRVYITYGTTSTPQYYVNVDAIPPCDQWQAKEDQQFWLRIYFEDAAGNYWELDPAANLQSLSGPVDLGSLTDKTSAWNGSPGALSCGSG
jgi:hypothetical protein